MIRNFGFKENVDNYIYAKFKNEKFIVFRFIRGWASSDKNMCQKLRFSVHAF
jgi:hypothetical protein